MANTFVDKKIKACPRHKEGRWHHWHKDCASLGETKRFKKGTVICDHGDCKTVRKYCQ